MRVRKNDLDNAVLDYAAIHEVVRAAEARRAEHAGRAMAAFGRLIWSGLRRHSADVAGIFRHRPAKLRTEAARPR